MLSSKLQQLYAMQFRSNWQLAKRVTSNRSVAAVHQLAAEPKKLTKSSIYEKSNEGLNILFYCNFNNSLTQKAYLELTSRGHKVKIIENPSKKTMIQAARRDNYDLILCPFMTKRVPSQLFDETATAPCWIIHPGITGDAGMHSIDWALHDQLPEWGVTIVQAADKFDSGDIYGTCTFPIRGQPTKSTLYQNEIKQAAMKSLLEAIDNFRHGIPPRPLDYDQPDIKGYPRPNMDWTDRLINWESMSSQEIARVVRMSDTQPGAIWYTNNTAYGARIIRLLFGANVEGSIELVSNRSHAKAGDIIAKRNGAALFKCSDGKGLWISHMKGGHGSNFIKLPATAILSPTEMEGVEEVPPEKLEYLCGERPQTFQEIWTVRDNKAIYIHFEFYNGAMTTEQCVRLRKVIHHYGQDPTVNTVVLCGGYDYFSNGINLNTIEASVDPAVESWRNINAIDDVVKEIFSIRDKLVISAVQGNAGAGGAMMALAADLVWSHDDVVLNPHYKSMGLFGSEYYTYFLPQRVGEEKAKEITDGLKPMLARQAVQIGMFDKLIAKDRSNFQQMLRHHVTTLLKNDSQVQQLLHKRSNMMTDEWFDLLDKHRSFELEQMQICFQSNDYIEARRKFVYH